MGELDAGLDSANKAVELTDDPYALYIRGTIYVGLDGERKAREDLVRLIVASPELHDLFKRKVDYVFGPASNI